MLLLEFLSPSVNSSGNVLSKATAEEEPDRNAADTRAIPPITFLRLVSSLDFEEEENDDDDESSNKRVDDSAVTCLLLFTKACNDVACIRKIPKRQRNSNLVCFIFISNTVRKMENNDTACCTTTREKKKENILYTTSWMLTVR